MGDDLDDESRVIPDDASGIIISSMEDGTLSVRVLFPADEPARGPAHDREEDRPHVLAALHALMSLSPEPDPDVVGE